MDYLQTYNFWKQNVKDKQLSLQLEKMSQDNKAIENAFYKDLEFGTAGLRGIIGVGTNCLNIYTIMRTTMGVAKYMQNHNMQKVAICYDSRIKSKLFARVTSNVLNSCGIKTYLSNDCAPTPFCSYMVRYYGCALGIMITASHNPKMYNGYKVYSHDGTQLLEEPSYEISNIVNSINPFEIKTRSFNYYVKNGLVEYTDDNIIAAYLKDVQKQSLNKIQPLKVVYTPLNGAGYSLVPKNLSQLGLEVIVAKEQGYPNGNFTTCPKPNPEKPEAYTIAKKYGEPIKADLLLATDPDCDRVGAAVLHNGEYVLLTGNEMGALLCDYVLSNLQKQNKLTQDHMIVKSIVTTSLASQIAQNYGVKCENVLTGFKYIGNLIYKLEQQNKGKNFILGFEESYGYLVGDYVRDKDAVLASMLICEMASVYKAQSITLIDKLNELFEKYGYYKHVNVTYEFAGADGNKKMKQLLSDLRKTPFVKVANLDVVSYLDYQQQDKYDLPKADVLEYNLSNGGSLIIRPSGTEPLIKAYITTNKTPELNELDIQNIKQFLSQYFK